MKRTNRRTSRIAIDACEEFNNSTGSLSGRKGYRFGVGRLNAEEAALYRSAENIIAYTVYSYDTPIGWVSNGVWYRVREHFSQTTSCHQGMVPRTGTPVRAQ